MDGQTGERFAHILNVLLYTRLLQINEPHHDGATFQQSLRNLFNYRILHPIAKPPVIRQRWKLHSQCHRIQAV